MILYQIQPIFLYLLNKKFHASANLISVPNQSKTNDEFCPAQAHELGGYLNISTVPFCWHELSGKGYTIGL